MSTPATSGDVSPLFTHHQIVPDVIPQPPSKKLTVRPLTLPPTTAPSLLSTLPHPLTPPPPIPPSLRCAQLVYDDGSTVETGNELLVSSTQKVPTVSFPTQSGRYYSLLMIDPDNDTRETHLYRQFLHWFVINIPGQSSGQSVDVNHGFAVSPYMGCGPDPAAAATATCSSYYEQQALIATEHIKVLGAPRLLGLVGQLRRPQEPRTSAAGTTTTPGGKQPTLLAGNFFFAEIAK